MVALAAWSAANCGDSDRAERLCVEAEELCGDPDDPTMVEVMQIRMLVATAARDIETASVLEQRMVDWARRNAAPYDLAVHLQGLAAQQATIGQRELAVANAREALEVARAHDNVLALPGALTAFALAVLDDDPEAARQQLVEAESVWERYPDLPSSDIGHMLGAIVCRQPRRRAAQAAHV
jgi:hypothetical protein